MLKTLIIKNIMLIEEARIEFENGFTVITGETGAGKTALIEGLRLLMGERADNTKVRKGCEKGFLQASFSLEPAPVFLALFEESALSFPIDEDLILTREMKAEGKSRALVNGQMVPTSFLQKMAPYLIDFVGQHAQILFKNEQEQRKLLDLYGDIDLSLFHAKWEEEKNLRQNLEQIQKEKSESVEKKASLQEQIEEIEKGALQEDEETLFAEYTLLANAQELLEHSFGATEKIDFGKENATQLQKIVLNMEKHAPEMRETGKMTGDLLILLEEIRQNLQGLEAKLESNPHRLLYLEDKLKTFHSLKKKFGSNPVQKCKELQKELEIIETYADREDELKTALNKAEMATTREVTHLREKRQTAAKELEKKLSASLQQLGFASAKLRIVFHPTIRSKTGEDRPQFFLRANKGEQEVPIRDSSSGGELSRLLFAMKILLAEKSEPPTMVFDEIDANVGGQTATLIGEQLHKLGSFRQVFCVTHFPQVARQGDQHICISKKEESRRTLGQITVLSKPMREEELLRMMGSFVTIN